MNKEIKKEMERELETLILRIIEQDDAVRVIELDDIADWIDRKLKKQYLQGAKDMWWAMRLDFKEGGFYDEPNAFNDGYNRAIEKADVKAQQFIDSLTKEKEC